VDEAARTADSVPRTLREALVDRLLGLPEGTHPSWPRRALNRHERRRIAKLMRTKTKRGTEG